MGTFSTPTRAHFQCRLPSGGSIGEAIQLSATEINTQYSGTRIDLRGPDGSGPYGRVLIDLESESPFASTGVLYFAAAGSDSLDGDLVSDTGHFEGRIRINYTANGVLRSEVIEITPDFSTAGNDAVTDELSLVSVARLQQRLNHLGFVDADGKALAVDGIIGPKTQSALRLFKGTLSSDIDQSPAAISPELDQTTLTWLNAVNAPRWVELVDPELPAAGLYVQNGGDFDILPGRNPANGNLRDGSVPQPERFGTSWAVDLIKAVGEATLSDGSDIGTFLVNGLSTRNGAGSATWHATHQAGMDIDINIPKHARNSSIVTPDSNTSRSDLNDGEKALFDLMQAFYENAPTVSPTNIGRFLLGSTAVVAAFNNANSVNLAVVDTAHTDHLHVDLVLGAGPT
ncbi:MAG: peptidoglycan-binding domain-containing protein, partial [Pirellulaceae bacterium]